jgi:hypothetical protein
MEDDATGIDSFTSPTGPTEDRPFGGFIERPREASVLPTAEEFDGIGAVGTGAVE